MVLKKFSDISEKNLLFAVSAAVGVVLSAMFIFGLFGTYQQTIGDLLYSGRIVSEDIVIVKIDEESIDKIGAWPWKRRVFAQALSNIENASVIGMDVLFFDKRDENDDRQLARQIASMDNVVIAAQFEEGVMRRPIFNSTIGHANLIADEDGVVRRLPKDIEDVTPLSAAIIKKLDKSKSYPESREIVNFGLPRRYLEIPFWRAFEEKQDVEGKIVLIGATAEAFHDAFPIPTSKQKFVPGVEIHGHMIQSVLQNDFLKEQSRWSVVAIIFIIGFIVAFLIGRLRFIYSISIAFGLLVVFIIGALLIAEKGIIANVFYPAAAFVFNTAAAAGAKAVHETKSRQQITKIFGKYVAEDVVKEILAARKGEEIELRGKRRVVSVLFADVRGFTTMSEQLAPEEVVKLLNTYLSSMTDAILEEKGTIDKYIGDAIMAFWNAPLEQKDYALRAVKAAIAMQKAAAQLVKKEGQQMQYGIGINTGFAVIGNIGSTKRLEYTAIGDTVNLASRLCSTAKANEILISLETYNMVKEHIKTEKYGTITVKGRKQPVEVYKVIVET